eukprot:Opistho-2@42997
MSVPRITDADDVPITTECVSGAACDPSDAMVGDQNESTRSFKSMWCLAPSPLWVVYLLSLEIGATSGILSLADLLLTCAPVSKEWYAITVGIAKRRVKSVHFSRLRRRSDETIERLARFLPSLEQIALPGCLLVTSGAFMSLTACTSITSIDFRGCARICDRAVSSLASACPRLERFVTGQCPLLTDLSMLMLAQCTRLTAVEITFCPSISPDGIQALTACTQLREASFSTGVGLGNEVLAAIGRNCRELRTLFIGNTSNAGLPGFAAIGHLSHLRRLSLKRCDMMTDTCLMHLSHLPDIELFQLSNAPLVTDGGLAAIVSRCKKLVSLAVAGCVSTNGAFLSRFASPGNLRRLSVARCPRFDDLAAKRHVTAFTGLESLDLSWTSVDNDALSAVCAACTGIIHLCVDGCRGIGDVGVTRVISLLPSLSEVSVEGCEGVTDDGLVHMAASVGDNCGTPPRLPRIRLSGCPHVTQRGVAAVALAGGGERSRGVGVRVVGGAEVQSNPSPFAVTSSGEAWAPFGTPMSLL